MCVCVCVCVVTLNVFHAYIYTTYLYTINVFIFQMHIALGWKHRERGFETAYCQLLLNMTYEHFHLIFDLAHMRHGYNI